MRAVYDAEGLMMTAAVSAGYLTIDHAYDIPAMAETLDLIQIMTYDYHGYWDGPHLDKRTGHNSPLYALPNEEDPKDPWYGLNTDFSMKYWVAGGARKDQLLMGAYCGRENLVSASRTLTSYIAHKDETPPQRQNNVH